VYGEDVGEADKVSTNIESANIYYDEAAKDTRLRIVTMHSVPVGWTIVKGGLIASRKDNLIEDVDDLPVDNENLYIRGKSTDVNNYEYTWNKTKIAAGETWYFRSYLEYKKPGDETVYKAYGDVFNATAPSGS